MRVTEELKAKATLVHQRLCTEYGCPVPYDGDLDPLSGLVAALLSHRMDHDDAARALAQLRSTFPTWEVVRDAAAETVQAAIGPATRPALEASRIQRVLREISERRGGALSLDFLAELGARAARDWLESLPGIGPKTSAAVLLCTTLRMPALPVDSNHHRVAQRLALIPARVPVGPAHLVLQAQLPADWDAQRLHDNHASMKRHGERCCYYHAPDCGRCVVLDLCPYGQRRLARGSGPLARLELADDEPQPRDA